MLVTHRKASIDEIEKAWHGDVEAQTALFDTGAPHAVTGRAGGLV